MTIADAIIEFEKQLHSAVVVLDSGFGSHPGENDRVYRKRKELAEIALHALRAQQEAEKNEPLTLDELRGMAKKPKLTKGEIIKSLLDQALDKDSLSIDDDSIFALDAKALREAAELLKAVPEWISVKDRMPEEKEDVLVLVRAGDASWLDVMYWLNGIWYRENVHPCGYPITHWMPIQKPPTKE